VRQHLDVTGPATLDQVWDRYVRPARWSSWSPQIRAVDYPEPELVAGTAGVVRGPLGLALPFEILAVDVERRCWSWRVKPPVGEMILAHTVTAAAGGTRTGLDVDGPALLVVPYLPIARLALRRLVR
jgi:hypothetical protein